MLHESVVAVVVGAMCGVMIQQIDHITVKFNTDIFWYLVLPPIIFAQGYTLKKRNFFRYIDKIVVYGIFGTILTFIAVAIAAYYISRWDYIWDGGCNQFLFLQSQDEDPSSD